LVVQNFTQTYGSFAPSWSITNELFYYVFYGALAVLTARGRKQPAWLGMGICLVAAVVFQTLHLTVAHNPVVSSTGHLFGLGINWFLGALVAVHAETLARCRFAQVIARAWLPVLLATMAARYAGVLPIQGMYLISGVAFALLLVRLLETPSVPAPRTDWAERAAGWLGLASYPTYLFHGPLIILIGSAVLRGGLSLTNCFVTWTVLTVAGIACGVVLGFVAERPIMEWRGQMLRRLKRS
jgi:peptidoglycan/LPS O-acetylase OafA/YrhL